MAAALQGKVAADCAGLQGFFFIQNNVAPCLPTSQAALLRRALLHHAAKRGLRPPCGAEAAANAKRRRLE